MLNTGNLEVLATSIERGGTVGSDNRDLIVAALRIAARVTRPGVIEGVLSDLPYVPRGTIEYFAEHLRKALTDA